MGQYWYSEINFVLLFVIHIRVSPYFKLGVGFGWIRWVCSLIKRHTFQLIYDFITCHHNHLRDTIHKECIKEDGGVRSCLIELEPFRWESCISTQYTVTSCTFHFLLERCKTWFGQIKLYWVLMFRMHKIHNCKEYRQSFSANFSSRHQC